MPELLRLALCIALAIAVSYVVYWSLMRWLTRNLHIPHRESSVCLNCVGFGRAGHLYRSSTARRVRRKKDDSADIIIMPAADYLRAMAGKPCSVSTS